MIFVRERIEKDVQGISEMKASNRHIEEYLKYYLLELQQPGFAVLIKGGWGSGKTHFVSQFIEGHCPRNDALKDKKNPLPLMISLFGVQSKSDIDERIYEATHAITSKPITQFGFSVIRGAAKIGALINGGGDAVTAIETGSDLLVSLWKRLTESSNIILIFDDVERADMDLRELLGVINPFVEGQKLHCILIAEEHIWDKVNTAEESEDSKLGRLAAVKEKVIGKTFQIQTDPVTVFDCWLTPSGSPLGNRAQNSLVSRTEILHKVFVCAPKQNFRAMLHTFMDYQRFIGSEQHPILEKRHLDNAEFMDRFIVDFFCIQYWAHLGEIDADGIGESTFKERVSALQIKPVVSEPQSNWERLEDCLGAFSGILSHSRIEQEQWLNLWKEWLSQSWLSKDRLHEIVNDSIWFDGSAQYWANQYFAWTTLSDEDATRARFAFEVSFKNYSITKAPLIFHFFDHSLFLSKQGALEKSSEQVLQEFVKYVNELGDRLEPMELSSEFDHYRISCATEPEEIEFKKHLEDKVASRMHEKRIQWNKELVDLLPHNAQEVASRIDRTNIKERINYLTELDVDAFIDSYCKLDSSDSKSILGAIERRYAVVGHCRWLLCEGDVLQRLKKRSEVIFSQCPKPLPPSIFRLHYLNQRIDKALAEIAPFEQPESKPVVIP